mmetsp:Transcript_10703/g.16241  ORF Transcript_10703/g.16241 Transcript_10703/m.16241 type:complete len:383 (-) Transcript_10703:122-1270(-)
MMMMAAWKRLLQGGGCGASGTWKGACWATTTEAQASLFASRRSVGSTESCHRPALSFSTISQKQQDNEAWKNPDHAPDPNAHVKYLNRIFEGMSSSSGPVVDYKRTIYDLMEIKAGDSIVDIGCGTGADVLAFSERLLSSAASKKSNDGSSGGESVVVGVDISETMVQTAHKNLSKSRLGESDTAADDENALKISFCVGNAEDLSGVILSNTFDICRCDRSLQHVENPQSAVQEMVRITKPGGTIVISEPDWETLVVDSPSYAKTTRMILNHFTNTRVNGWMGRQLPRLLKNTDLSSGLVENVRVLPLVSPVQDLTFVREAYLDKARKLAVEASVVTKEEASDWMEELVGLDEAGLFFSSLTIYVARGTVRSKRKVRKEGAP